MCGCCKDDIRRYYDRRSHIRRFMWYILRFRNSCEACSARRECGKSGERLEHETNIKKRPKDTHHQTTLWIMRAEDRMASLQLRKVLNRLEEEEGEKQEALKKRVEEERGKLEATMGFSRAAAVAALAQEVELQNARKVEKARLKVTSKSNPTPTLPEASPESDRDRLLIENQRLAEEVAQLRARIHEMAGAAGSDAARPGVTIDGPAPSSTVPPLTIKAGTASADDSNCRIWKGGMGKINEEEFNRLLEIEAATVLEELRANPPAHVKALLRVRQELDACAAAAVAVRNSTSILLSSGLLPAMAGGDVRDGTAGISSSEGTKAALRGVGTISAEVAHS